MTEQGMWTAEFTKAFRRKLGAAGYIGMGWPKEYGGGGRSRIYQAILWDEMEYHRAPGHRPFRHLCAERDHGVRAPTRRRPTSCRR